MRAIRFITLFLLFQSLCPTQRAQSYVAHYRYAFPGAQLYRVPSSGTVIYVESDGRHLAAISRAGKLLWNRDPFKDAGLPFYRFKDPQVANLGAAARSGVLRGQDPSQFVSIHLTNSQFGFIRISDGEFLPEGQD
jgi:hypothetical protein